MRLIFRPSVRMSERSLSVAERAVLGEGLAETLFAVAAASEGDDSVEGGDAAGGAGGGGNPGGRGGQRVPLFPPNFGFFRFPPQRRGVFNIRGGKRNCR